MITDGLWGFIGVVTGLVFSIIFKYIFEIRNEKKENKNYFIKNNYNIQNCIIIIKKVILQFYNFSKMNIEKENYDLFLEEYQPTLSRFSKDCTLVWNDFRDNLLFYFQNIIDDKSLQILDNNILDIIYFEADKNILDYELLINIQKNFKNKENELEYCVNILNSIEKQYNKLRKEYFKKRI